MKYRHTFHAGNFANVHKHVVLLALLRAMKRKETPFVYLETHAGRGEYATSHATSGSSRDRTLSEGSDADELRAYAELIAAFRAARNDPQAYPGSPLIAAHELREQDRAILAEIVPGEARQLERALRGHSRVQVENADGFERLRAWLPPAERRGLVLIDPPFEESRLDYERITLAIHDALQRFGTGVFVAWYPIKDERRIRAWHSTFIRAVAQQTLSSELWLYPRDSQVALNGSGMLIVNPPYLFEERLRLWLPELRARLDMGHAGGTSIQRLPSES